MPHLDEATSLFDAFDRTCQTHPAQPALDFGDRTYDYRTLRAAVESLAARLEAAAGADPAVRAIGLLASRDPGAFVAYLAILRIGRTVVPISAQAPPSRILEMAADASITLLATGFTVPPALSEALVGAGVTLVHTAQEADGADATVTGHPAGLDDIAYILFTSGSTGRPKAVPISHRSALAYLTHAVDRAGVRAGHRLSHAFELTFDPSLFDMFAAWSTGATMCIPHARDLWMPARYVRRFGITHWYSVPSIVSLARRANVLGQDTLQTLVYSQFIGEQLTYEQALAWRLAAPGSVMDNVYGPTELTVACTAYRLPDSTEDWPRSRNGTIPIGEAFPQLDLAVIGQDGHLTRDGELCVRGVQRFDGYLDAADDDGRFLAIDADGAQPLAQGVPIRPAHWYRTGDRVREEDGVLVHLGRLDRQVKLNGYRIELGEIEAELRRHPAVEDAVAFVVPNRHGFDVLRAALTGRTVPPAELAAHLNRRLPPYMVPEAYSWHEAMPLNANGKIDVRRLTVLAAG